MKMFINSTLVLIVLVVLVGHLVSARGNHPVAVISPTWTYIVEPGDQLMAIARRFYPKQDPREVVWEIRQLNNNVDPGRLQIGYRLKMPRGSNQMKMEVNE